MLLDDQRRLIAPLIVHRPVTGRLTLYPANLAQILKTTRFSSCQQMRGSDLCAVVEIQKH